MQLGQAPRGRPKKSVCRCSERAAMVPLATEYTIDLAAEKLYQGGAGTVPPSAMGRQSPQPLMVRLRLKACEQVWPAQAQGTDPATVRSTPGGSSRACIVWISGCGRVGALRPVFGSFQLRPALLEKTKLVGSVKKPCELGRV